MLENNNERPNPMAGMSCRKTDCEKGLHSSVPPRKKPKKSEAASQETSATIQTPTKLKCHKCDTEWGDLDRLHKRDLEDIEFTVECLNTEWISHQYWSVLIDKSVSETAWKRGLTQIDKEAHTTIRHSIASAKPFRDGSQTPFDGDIVYYAQHATATCCRKCLERWHGIPRGRELTREEISFCVNLMMQYVNKRLPYLTEGPGGQLCLPF